MSDIIYFDEALFKHSVNVLFLSLLIGLDYYSANEDLYDLAIAALLHDYGKIFLPEHILNKKDALTKEEKKVIELHPMVGYSYLQSKTSLSVKILESIKDHHEKVDGSGYGLRKTLSEISEDARIISIADVYDAMGSDRVYRRKLSKDDIYRYLIDNKGKHFEQEILNIFLAQIDEIIPLKELEYIQESFRKLVKATTGTMVENG